MSCVRGLLNVAFQIFNILFCLSGVGLIALGGLIFMVLCTNDNSRPGQFVPMWLVIIGLVIFYISITGFVGSCMENTSMLITFSVTILAILIVQSGLGTWAYIKIKDEKIQLQEMYRCCNIESAISKMQADQTLLYIGKPICDALLFSVLKTIDSHVGHILLGYIGLELVCIFIATVLGYLIRRDKKGYIADSMLYLGTQEKKPFLYKPGVFPEVEQP